MVAIALGSDDTLESSFIATIGLEQMTKSSLNTCPGDPGQSSGGSLHKSYIYWKH